MAARFLHLKYLGRLNSNIRQSARLNRFKWFSEVLTLTVAEKAKDNLRYREKLPNDGRQEGVVKDGGNGRHTLVYKMHGEKKTLRKSNGQFVICGEKLQKEKRTICDATP